MSAASSAAPQATGSSRVWERFTPRQRLSRFAVYLGLVAAIVASARTVEVIPEFLYDAPQQVQDLLERMWPIAWHHYAGGVHDALVDTLLDRFKQGDALFRGDAGVHEGLEAV